MYTKQKKLRVIVSQIDTELAYAPVKEKRKEVEKVGPSCHQCGKKGHIARTFTIEVVNAQDTLPAKDDEVENEEQVSCHIAMEEINTDEEENDVKMQVMFAQFLFAESNDGLVDRDAILLNSSSTTNIFDAGGKRYLANF